MSILDTFIGGRSLRRQRDEAIDYARDLYDPSVYDPMLSEQRTRATEGIGEAGDIARARTVQSLFSPTATMTQTGNQGRALALQQQQQQGRSQALSQFESMLSERDIQTRQQAQQQFAQTRGQQLQTTAQREAAEEQAQLQYEAERSRRKQALGGAALGVVGTLATTPFGAGEGSSLVQRGLGKIFGGGGEEAAEGGLGNIFGSGGSFDAFMDADFSGGDTEESVVGVPNLAAGILGEQGLNLTGQLFGSTPTLQSQPEVGMGQQSQTGEVSEETSGFDRQAVIQGMRDDIDVDQLLRDFNQRETTEQPSENDMVGSAMTAGTQSFDEPTMGDVARDVGGVLGTGIENIFGTQQDPEMTAERLEEDRQRLQELGNRLNQLQQSGTLGQIRLAEQMFNQQKELIERRYGTDSFK